MTTKSKQTKRTPAKAATKAKGKKSATPVAAQRARDAAKLDKVLATPAKTEKSAPAPATDSAMAKAVSASWADKATRAARTTRHGCKVGNKTYPSVKAAFLDHGWPLGIHQRIRLIVKREGSAEVEGKKIVLVKG